MDAGRRLTAVVRRHRGEVGRGLAVVGAAATAAGLVAAADPNTRYAAAWLLFGAAAAVGLVSVLLILGGLAADTTTRLARTAVAAGRTGLRRAGVAAAAIVRVVRPPVRAPRGTHRRTT